LVGVFVWLWTLWCFCVFLRGLEGRCLINLWSKHSQGHLRKKLQRLVEGWGIEYQWINWKR
jgi:hypothetical protein